MKALLLGLIAVSVLVAGCSGPGGPENPANAASDATSPAGSGAAAAPASPPGPPPPVAPAGGPSASVGSVACGDYHNCAITGAGGVKCWGDNLDGELGDGSRTFADAAVPVIGLSSGVTRIAAGARHTCAVLASGQVSCWGDNAAGQLGDGTTEDRDRPVLVPGVTDAVAVTAGRVHTCVLTAAGAVKCWGDNEFGKLGDAATAAQSLLPVAIPGVVGALSVTAGGSQTCILQADRHIRCIGLLNDTTNDSPSHEAVAVAAGEDHACLIEASGQGRCWGRGERGLLGDGKDGINHPDELPIVGGYSFVAIAPGTWHTCALTSTSQVTCWGSAASGELGQDMVELVSNVPVDVPGLSGVTAIASGWGHSCVRMSTGLIQCWGEATSLGRGPDSVTPSSTPAPVIGF